MFLIADNYCIYVLGHSIHLALHPYPLPRSKCELEGPLLHSAPHHFAIPPSLVMRVGGEIPPFLPWRLSHHPHHHTLTSMLYLYHPDTSLAASTGWIGHSSSSGGAWDMKRLEQIVCFVFVFVFHFKYFTSNYLQMYYIGSNHQPPLHPMVMKGAWDTDMSQAQVCFFFSFFSFLLILLMISF